MFFPSRIPGLVSELLLALVASTSTVWAQTTNQNPSVPPVTVTLHVPTLAHATSTTIQLQISTDMPTQQTAIQVTSDANPSAPTIIAASVGSDSIATVPVDVSDAFAWAVSPNPTRPGCGPHPPAGTPGCAHADTTTAISQPANLVLGPAALGAISDDSSVEVAGARTGSAAPSSSVDGSGAQTTSAPDPSASSAPEATAASPAPTSESAATLASTSAAVLHYTVQPGDTLTAIARRLYGDTDALDQIVQANLGQPMPDGRTFADSNHIWPGWILTLPQPTQLAVEQDGQRWYVVQSGDTLSSIAAELLGSANRWPELYEHNRDRIEAPSRIRVGLELQLPLHLPVSPPAKDPTQPVQADGPVPPDHPKPDAPTPRQDAAEVPPTSVPGTSITPRWASPIRSDLESTAARTTTPARQPPAVARQVDGVVSTSVVSTSVVSTSADTDATPRLASEPRPDRETPSAAGESQTLPLAADNPQRPWAAAAAALATIASIALGLWLIRRVSRARLQPRALLLATCSADRLADTRPPAGRPRNHPDPAADSDLRARRRALVLQAVQDGTLASEDAATQLEVSTRQLRRLLAAYRDGGVDALRHANAGRVPAHAVPDQVRRQIVELVRTRYAGLSQSELAQRLATEHGIQLHRTTVRRILMSADLATAPRSTDSPAVCSSDPERGSAQRAVHTHEAGHALMWRPR